MGLVRVLIRKCPNRSIGFLYVALDFSDHLAASLRPIMFLKKLLKTTEFLFCNPMDYFGIPSGSMFIGSPFICKLQEFFLSFGRDAYADFNRIHHVLHLGCSTPPIVSLRKLVNQGCTTSPASNWRVPWG